MGALILTKVDGWIDLAKYQGMMEDKILSVLRGKMGRSFILQQDNARAHTSFSTKDFFSREKVSLLDWPAQSPDINPIENVWAWMQGRINKKL